MDCALLILRSTLIARLLCVGLITHFIELKFFFIVVFALVYRTFITILFYFIYVFYTQISTAQSAARLKCWPAYKHTQTHLTSAVFNAIHSQVVPCTHLSMAREILCLESFVCQFFHRLTLITGFFCLLLAGWLHGGFKFRQVCFKCFEDKLILHTYVYMKYTKLLLLSAVLLRLKGGLRLVIDSWTKLINYCLAVKVEKRQIYSVQMYQENP